MMLIEHQPVEAEILGVDLFVEVFIEQHRSLLRIEVLVGQAEEATIAEDLAFQKLAARRFGFWIVVILPFGKPHYMHSRPPLFPSKLLSKKVLNFFDELFRF